MTQGSDPAPAPAPEPEPDSEPTDVPPPAFDWTWMRSASVHELSAHGRAVQARMAAGPTPPPRRPSWLKRLRFRFFLARQRRRSAGSDRLGGV